MIGHNPGDGHDDSTQLRKHHDDYDGHRSTF